MSAYQYKGPLGIHKGSKEKVQQLSEISPKDVQLQHHSWNGTRSLREAFPEEYRDGYYKWGGKYTMNRGWFQLESLKRKTNLSYDYIGPRFMSESL